MKLLARTFLFLFIALVGGISLIIIINVGKHATRLASPVAEPIAPPTLPETKLR